MCWEYGCENKERTKRRRRRKVEEGKCYEYVLNDLLLLLQKKTILIVARDIQCLSPLPHQPFALSIA
jgi:hypothetical protein